MADIHISQEKDENIRRGKQQFNDVFKTSGNGGGKQWLER